MESVTTQGAPYALRHDDLLFGILDTKIIVQRRREVNLDSDMPRIVTECRDAVRSVPMPDRSKEPVSVVVRGGVYTLEEPLCLGPGQLPRPRTRCRGGGNADAVKSFQFTLLRRYNIPFEDPKQPPLRRGEPFPDAPRHRVRRHPASVEPPAVEPDDRHPPRRVRLVG